MKTTQRKKQPIKTDLQDSKEDTKKLQPDEGTLDLPDVRDIPGQEHVRPFVGGEFADTTISSADEEGKGLLDTEEDLINDDVNVTKTERDLLQRSSESMATGDDEQLGIAALDDTDEDGTPLNETIDISGADLDVPGAEEDDSNENLGEEDEENNSYSLPDQDEK